MAAPQGIVTFPGIQYILEAEMPFTIGISPSVATIVMVPQARCIADSGTLRFQFAGETVEFHDCKVDLGSLSVGESGQVWRVSIFDRRWKWKFGKIGGAYNVRHGDGNIRAGTEKAPREMAKLCIEAMGEKTGDIGAMPDDARPEVHWDCAVPAEALANLADLFNCCVVLGLDGTVDVAKLGEGNDLPQGLFLSGGLTIDPPQVPKTIAIVCGPTRADIDSELEAVGMEYDDAGTIRKIADLTYKPEDGWETEPPGFPNVYDLKGEIAEQCAEKSVYKWYRIKTPLTLPDGTRITDLGCILLEDELAETVVDGVAENRQPTIEQSKLTRPKKARVGGVFWREGGNDYENTTAEFDRTADAVDHPYHNPFEIDQRLRMVVFDEPVFKQNKAAASANIEYAPADLVLRCASTFLDPDTYAPIRYTRERSTGAKDNDKTLYVKHDEIQLTYTIEGDSNQKDVDKACDYYLDAIMAAFQTRQPQTIQYTGLRFIPLDGAIRQVTYSVGAGGATTTASRDTEQSHNVIPYEQRRRIEKSRIEARKIQDLPDVATPFNGRELIA